MLNYALHNLLITKFHLIPVLVFIWSQEEHRNMGAWTFIKPRFENMCGQKIIYSGRSEAATTATGVSNWHKLEAEDIVENPFRVSFIK